MSTPPATLWARLAHLQRADVGRVLDDLQAAEHVAFGIGEGLALLGGQRRGQRLDVVADQLLVLQEDARALPDGHLAPGLERVLRGGDGGLDFIRRGHRHAGQALLRRGVDHVAPLGAARLDEFAVDQQRNTGQVFAAHARSPSVRCHRGDRFCGALDGGLNFTENLSTHFARRQFFLL